MTTVFFLRHGPTQENTEGRIQGQQPGTLLLPETEAYINAVAPLLRPKSPQILMCSDLDRAVRTCQILKQALQIPELKEAYNPLLREKAMGYYEGMLWKEVPAEFQSQRGQVNYDFRKFGGENNTDVRSRVIEVLRRLSLQYPNQRVACVTHAGWIQQLVAVADSQGILPDGWTGRNAMYEAGVSSSGQLQYFHPIALEEKLADPNED